MKKLLAAVLSLLLTGFPVIEAQACTGISFRTQDGARLQARTIEWGGFSLNSQLVILPRGQKNTALTPQGPNGLSWTNKYGVVGISLVKDPFIGEGVNEKGLAAGIFYFSGYGSLAPFNPKRAKKSVADVELVRWMLTNFATVEEVIQGLKKIDIVTIYPPQKGQTEASTGHWRIADATGRSIVLEIEDNGQRHIYENTAGVLTNSPSFPWQVTNLNNYVNLKSGTAKGFEANGIQIKSFGATSSLLGLPGDYTPPSRFVRAFFSIKTAPQMPNAEKGIRQAFQILKGFTIPIGMEFAPGEKIPNIPSATQWTALSNLSDREFYYNTMYNPLVRKVDLKKIDFETVQKTVSPLETQLEPVFKEIYFN